MRKIVALICLLIASMSWSQDMIVTNDGDSIECKITRVENGFLHFTVYDKSGIPLMRSRLPLSSVMEYTKQRDEVIDDNQLDPFIKEDNNVVFDGFNPSLYRLALNTGYTYQLEGYEGLPNSYATQMQSLWSFGGDLHFFLTDNIGLGFKANHIYTNANEDFEPPYSGYFGFSELRDEKVRFNYLAISLLYRKYLYDDQVINYAISGGQIMYRTDGLGDGVPFYQEGKTLGMTLGAGYDFILSQHLGIGVTAEVNIAKLNEFNNNGTVVRSDFPLTRIDLTLGIRIY